MLEKQGEVQEKSLTSLYITQAKIETELKSSKLALSELKREIKDERATHKKEVAHSVKAQLKLEHELEMMKAKPANEEEVKA